MIDKFSNMSMERKKQQFFKVISANDNLVTEELYFILYFLF